MQFIKLHNAYNDENVAVNLDKVLKIEEGYGTSILYFSKKDKLEVNEKRVINPRKVMAHLNTKRQ